MVLHKNRSSIIFGTGMMLFILAIIASYWAVRNLSAIVPAECYEDKGVYDFKPYQVLPVQVKNTSAGTRNRRMNATRTVYMVYYKDADKMGYQWRNKAANREAGQDIVKEGLPVKRRILRIPDKGTYITVEPEQTAESYAADQQKRNRLALGISAVYILFYLLTLCILWGRWREDKR